MDPAQFVTHGNKFRHQRHLRSRLAKLQRTLLRERALHSC